MSVVMQRGFSMIEVLVSLLVLTFGVIGAAGMQLAAFRTSQQAAFQTAALQLATELADKMRANDQAMRRATGENPFIDLDYSTTSDPVAPGKFCYGADASANCDPTMLARFDIYEWQRRLKAAFPSARVVVCNDSTPWDDSIGTYRWGCDVEGSTGAVVVIKVGWQGKNPDGSLIKNAQGTFAPNLALAVAPYIR
jgi:type IV pilus assembly protein PilV